MLDTAVMEAAERGSQLSSFCGKPPFNTHAHHHGNSDLIPTSESHNTMRTTDLKITESIKRRGKLKNTSNLKMHPTCNKSNNKKENKSKRAHSSCSIYICTKCKPLFIA